MGIKAQSRELRQEEARRARYLTERGWYRLGSGWRHRNMTFGWSLESAMRLETEADADKDLADQVHGILRGVY